MFHKNKSFSFFLPSCCVMINVYRFLKLSVVCKTWAGLIGLGSTLGWALLNFVLGWAQIWAGLKYGLGSIEGHFRQKVN